MKTAIEAQNATSQSYKVLVAALSDTGTKRPFNEDSIRCTLLNRHPSSDNQDILAIVADGMGGHAGGDVASQLAVEIISNSFLSSNSFSQASLVKAFSEANQKIYNAAQRNTSLNGMGTTCTALLISNGNALYAQVGDSRLYLVRGKSIYQMSEDHSVVMQMVREGVISKESAARHPDKNVILRALGTNKNVEVSCWPTPFPIQVGDSFFICSDGLYDLVKDIEIYNIVSLETPHKACELLVSLANFRGGHDNISVGVVKIEANDTFSHRPIPETREIKAL